MNLKKLEIKRSLNKNFGEVIPPNGLYVDSFMVEVYDSPFCMSRCLNVSLSENYWKLCVVREVNVLGWIYFRSFDNIIDGDNKPILNYGKLGGIYRKELAKLGVDFDLVNRSFTDSCSFPVTEAKVIERNRIYYLPYKSLFQGNEDFYKSLDYYLLAKQYLDDIKDSEKDFANLVPTLLTSKVPTVHSQSSLDLRLELVKKVLFRVGSILNKASTYLGSYPPYIKLLRNYRLVSAISRLFILR